MKNLPDILKCNNGNVVSTIKEWEDYRRSEILSIFELEVFGRVPQEKPDELSFEVAHREETTSIGVKKHISIHISKTFSVSAYVIIPKKCEKPCAVFLTPILSCQQKKYEAGEDTPFLPINDILKRGYGLMYFFVNDIDPDFDDQFKNGVHGIFDKDRTESSWGTIAAWAWGTRRMVDYIETDAELDSNKIILVGHSRGGKTALWAAATDERICMVVSNNSGCTGAAISRKKRGETIQDINTKFPHWFCENYKKYNGSEATMPFDQHMLLSLIAPRHLYVTSASEDIWADPDAEFESCLNAIDVYVLYSLAKEDKQSLSPPKYYRNGRVTYHLRDGKHGLYRYDWERFMDYADEYILPLKSIK